MTNFATFLAAHPWILILAAIWTIPWKGVALWRAARNQSISWFVVLLVINTLGILEIVYIFAFSKKTEEAPEPGNELKTIPEAPRPIEEQETLKTEKIIMDIEKDEEIEKENKKEEEKPNLDEKAPKE